MERSIVIKEVINEDGKPNIAVSTEGFSDFEVIGILTLIKEKLVSIKTQPTTEI